jgi:hypothetical protein
MIGDVQKALHGIVGSATILQNAAGAGRVFELFVMTGIGRALQARGYDVWVRRSNGSRVLPTDADRRFIQRGGAPTGIEPAMLGPNNASSIVFRHRHRRSAWELLNGIQFEGRSTADHEIDLAIVPEAVAQALRSTPTGGKPRGRPRVAVECKDVGTNGSVDEMRAFVARLYDLTLLRTHHPYLGVPGTAQAIHPGAPQARSIVLPSHIGSRIDAPSTSLREELASLPAPPRSPPIMQFSRMGGSRLEAPPLSN